MQRRTESTNVIRSLIFFIVIITADQTTKSFVRTYRDAWQGTFFRFTENNGIVFSIQTPNYFLWGLLLSAVGVLLFLCWRSVRLHRFYDLSIFSIIGGGGVSNIVDRFRFGAVTDIFIFPGGLLFNLADCFIIMGVFFLLCPPKFLHSNFVACKRAILGMYKRKN